MNLVTIVLGVIFIVGITMTMLAILIISIFKSIKNGIDPRDI